MISKIYENTTIIENMRNGNGSAILHKLEDIPDNLKMYACIELVPGSSIGQHTHIDDEEIIYCLSGEVSLFKDGICYNFSKGMVDYTKKGENHQIVNNSLSNATFLAIVLK